jgi:hypothetical protein
MMTTTFSIKDHRDNSVVFETNAPDGFESEMREGVAEMNVHEGWDRFELESKPYEAPEPKPYTGRVYDVDRSGPVCFHCALKVAEAMIPEMEQSGSDGESCWTHPDLPEGVVRRNARQIVGMMCGRTLQEEVERVYHDCPEFWETIKILFLSILGT